MCMIYMGLDVRSPVLGGGGANRGVGANNKGADQPAHPRRLISAFVIRFSEGIISRLATSHSFLACLYSRAGWFASPFVRNPEDRFSCDLAHMILFIKPFLDQWNSPYI